MAERVGNKEGKVEALTGVFKGSMDKLHAVWNQYNIFHPCKVMPKVSENI